MNSSGSPKVGDKVWRLVVLTWKRGWHEATISKLNEDGSVDLEWVTDHYSEWPGRHLSHKGVRFLPAGYKAEPGDVWAEQCAWSGR